MSLPLRQPADRLTGLQGNKTEKTVLRRFGAIRLSSQFAYNGNFLKPLRDAIIDEFYCKHKIQQQLRETAK